MTGKTGSGRRWGGTSGALLALLLLFRLLVPAGYMIAPDETGRPVLALCGGAGAEPAVGPTRGHRHHGHPGAPVPPKPDGHSCPIAALA
ncbi:MAG: hypothetical protein QOJ27_865, partial [Sphingomonadales bacterium]|nr:hypothetical protein [Sphingomonadales bacterium]